MSLMFASVSSRAFFFLLILTSYRNKTFVSMIILADSNSPLAAKLLELFAGFS